MTTEPATHECPANGCGKQVPTGKLMCPKDWARVPYYLQREVYAAWNNGRGRGSKRHGQAIMAAIEAVNGA